MQESRPTSGPATALASAAESQPATQPATQPAEEEPVQIVKGPNPEYERLKTQLRNLEQGLIESQTILHKKDEHPDIQALKARIAQVKKELEDTPAEVVTQKIYANPANRPKAPVLPPTDPLGIYTMAGALGDWNLAAREYKRLDDDLAAMKKTHDEMVSLMANFAAIRQRWEELKRKMDECQAELKVWQDRRNDIQIALELESAKRRTHMDTVQAAQEQFLPSSPKLSMILGFALFSALVGGAAWVLLLNLLDRTISTTDKAAELFNLPIHGVIGEIVSTRQRRIRMIWRWLGSPTVHLVVLIGIAAAALSIYLKLQYPDMFPQWKKDRLAFIYTIGLAAKDWIIDKVKSL